MTVPDPYRRRRFPPDEIAHAVWLYFRFPLSLRLFEDLLAERRIIVSHQTIRLSADKFARQIAGDTRRLSTRQSNGRWPLDEVEITIRGKKHWLWCAVDRDGFSGCADANSPQCQNGQTIDAQTAQEARSCASRHDHPLS